ncbi:MAG TPA: transglutaminase-like domain-containing protein [Bacteroidales bacterium]|nr:transglutaminase-like domain-containing protein [Bacteroidales bacterium]
MDSSEVNKELAALVNLIDEPDELIYKQIRDRILTYGKTAIPYLEKAWENNLQPLPQKRIEILLHKIQFETLCEDLNNWYSLGGTNLLTGYIIVSKFQYPNLDEQKIKKELERLKQGVWLEFGPELTAFEKAFVVNKILFTENKFEPDRSDLFSPLNYYLNNILETHKGNHLSLALIYLIIAGLAELPVFGVNLPEQFILAYMDEHKCLPGMPVSESEVLFYIAPFNKGSFFTHEEIDVFLKQKNIEPKYDYYRPCSNIVIIKRMLQELYNTYKGSGNTVKSGELEQILAIFK